MKKDLQSKAIKINDSSSIYAKEATDLKKITRWENLKIKIAVGGVSLAGVGYVCYKFFV
jgi:Synaptobrevin